MHHSFSLRSLCRCSRARAHLVFYSFVYRPTIRFPRINTKREANFFSHSKVTHLLTHSMKKNLMLIIVSHSHRMTQAAFFSWNSIKNDWKKQYRIWWEIKMCQPDGTSISGKYTDSDPIEGIKKVKFIDKNNTHTHSMRRVLDESKCNAFHYQRQSARRLLMF